jgi:GGDEF domain-containing protein
VPYTHASGKTLAPRPKLAVGQRPADTESSRKAFSTIFRYLLSSNEGWAMPIGFLKSGRTDTPQPRDIRSSEVVGQVLQDVEDLGIGMFWATDAEGAITFLSQQARREFDSTHQPVVGQQLTAVFKDAEMLPGTGSQRALAFKCKTRAKIDDHIVELRLARAGSQDKITRWWRISGRPLVVNNGDFLGYRGSAIDITSQYVKEVQVALQSQVDELTGLANRRKLTERLTATLAAFRQSRRSCALLMLDLDRFKQVNDNMGIRLATNCFSRLPSALPPSSAIVARSAGWAVTSFRCCCPTWMIAAR